MNNKKDGVLNFVSSACSVGLAQIARYVQSRMSSWSLSVDIQASSLKVLALVKSSMLDLVKMTKSINIIDDHNESQRQHLKEMIPFSFI